MALLYEYGKALSMIMSAYSLNSQEWMKVLIDQGQSPHVLKYWIEGLYKKKSIWKGHISPPLMANLQEKYSFDLPEISSMSQAQDGTVKFSLKFQDSLEVETVLIPFHKRFTVCLSTQVGCAMNCSFCYTGTQGLKRNLNAGEIVGQYLKAFEWIKENLNQDLQPSIVFMGQGEPLHNHVEVMKAIEILNDPKLVGVGQRHMTLSTVGYIPGLKQLSSFPQINFALSLHSPFDEERSILIPLNQRFPLKDIFEELDKLPLLKKQFIAYEYLLIKNFNMTDEHVDGLANLLGHRKAILNLIPFNPFPGSSWERPSPEDIEVFKEKLVARKLRVMVRTTKGSDILAACGQLKIENLSRQYGKQ